MIRKIKIWYVNRLRVTMMIDKIEVGDALFQNVTLQGRASEVAAAVRAFGEGS